jgi:MFS family permease
MMKSLLRHSDFRRLLAGLVLSMFGDSALLIALSIWTRDLTGSYAAAGAVFFVLALPSVVAPFGGYLVDRVRRRPFLIYANLGSALAVLPLIAVHGRGQVWLLYAVTLAYGVSYLLISAAMNGLLKTMLPEDLLADANGVLQSVREALRLIGPLAGAGIYAVFGGGTVAAVDAITFLAAALALLSLRVREQPAPPPEHHFWAEMSMGARHIFTEPVLRRTVAAAAVAFLVFGFAENVFYPMLDNLHKPTTFIGPLASCQGIGAIAGGLTAPWLIRRMGDQTVVGIGFIGFALGDLLFAVASLPVVIFGIIVAGVSIAWMVVAYVTMLQRRTPLPLMGRVSSAADVIIGTPQTLSIGLGALLIGFVDFRVLVVVMAVVVVPCGAYLLARRTTAPAVPVGARAAAEAGATDSVVSEAVPGIG